MKSIRRIAALFLAIMLLLSALPEALAATASYTGTINENDVFFRTGASTDAAFHCRLKKNTKVTVTGVRGNFYAVTYNRLAGYVMKKYVTLSASAKRALEGASIQVDSKITSAKAIAQIGSAPRATSRGSSGADVAKLQQALKIKKYYTGTVDGKYGDNTVAAVKKYQKAVGLSQTGKADSTTIKKLFNTSASSNTTTVKTDPKMNGITAISQITVPNTTRKGDSGKHVLALQQALKIKGYYTAPIDSKYGDQTAAAVRAFQKAKGLAQDGVAGNATIKALFGKNAANYTFKTERLDWFNGGSSVIPKGATFTVKDVSTGKTFRCRRWSGANHMDSEPLTATDTATIKALYGGSFSWTRRAILVQYNGHVYAASMNGMPHGTTTISSNGFDGHFCIHFYNSRTHETNHVDEAHQNCVARAMNATW